MEDRVQALEKRVDRLEITVNNVEKIQEGHSKDIQYIKEDLKTIKGNTAWTLRLIIGGIVMAILNFIIQGGMAQ